MLALPLLLAFVLAPGNGTPRKLDIPLADLVDEATIVCIGSVDHVIEVDVAGIKWTDVEWPDEDWESQERASLPIARIAIERVIKGPKNLLVAYHEGWRTWMCDTTRARPGERALLLLGPAGELASAPLAAQEAVKSVLGSAQVFRNLGSGDGIASIHASAGAETVNCAGTPRILWTDEREQAPLASVLRYIEELVEFSRDEAVVHMYALPDGSPSPFGGEDSFDARIQADGRCRIAVALGEAERVHLLRLEPRQWESLRARIASIVGQGDRVLGNVERRFCPTRRLRVRAQHGSLTYGVPREADDNWFAALDTKVLRDVVWAWDAVFQELNCADCYDYTLADRELLKGR